MGKFLCFDSKKCAGNSILYVKHGKNSPVLDLLAVICMMLWMSSHLIEWENSCVLILPVFFNLSFIVVITTGLMIQSRKCSYCFELYAFFGKI